MRLRPVAVVLAVVALDYAVWSWSLAGGSDLAGMVSGLTLPPLIAAALVLIAINLVRALGDATRRRPKPSAGTTSATRSMGRARGASRADGADPAGAGAPAIMKPDNEDQAAAASSRASSPKIAA